MTKEELRKFENQVRDKLRKSIVTNDHEGIVVTTSDTPNERIWIRFYSFFYMFETEYAIKNQTPHQIAGRFTRELVDDFNSTVFKKGVDTHE